ncbi:cysteine-rich receptor-like protein kinase 6 [Ananas comosus]|uniref:Cysteine-rich receptor-like protein kinase 6 n=1 Tax=Ananas comosus TaxID=4615 RepID=A0A6P5F9K7_ANACO|nr:cysteine-rich receptor-like protein kinase 6 [Ananas comosus]
MYISGLATMSCISFLFVVSLPFFLLHPPPAAAAAVAINFFGKFCGSTGNYTANSTYQSNLDTLFSFLASNASASPSGFTATTLGRVPDAVSGLALCRGDVNATTCRSCLGLAAQDGPELCPDTKGATLWYDPCLVEYSNQNFLSSTSNSPQLIGMSSQNITGAGTGQFDRLVSTLMNAVADRAANDTQRRFATGEVTNFTEAFPTIYGLAQCTPDLSASDCRQCLGGLIGEMPQYFAGRQGGRILGVRCNLRYEVYSFYDGAPSLTLSSAAATTQGKKKNVTSTVLAVTIPLVTAFVIISTICICFWRRRRSAPKGPLYYDGDAEEIKSAESLLIDLATLRAATANFAGENKLGEGGFGAVYKGLLPDGREIAVKRLSKDSGQGLGELKNELFLVAKLQHKNLVRLLGVCLEEQEKLLVYEYVPNRSLDTILFDSEKRGWLDWGRRYKIINGIARGLLYLHEDSQLKVVHRDLKASNILLDAEMNPKISDFGLARLFGGDHSQEITRRVVGTFGYMAPEYAMHGYFSNKSDVFSFGVMVLEIVTGRKNAGSFNSEQSEDLINYTWENWTKGTITEIVDSSLDNRYPRSEVLRCIHIGLLCVQENPADRPNMSRVVVMLSSSTVTLETPSKPAFCIGMSSMQFNMYSNASKYHGLVAEQSSSKSIPPSPNEVSITELEPR